MLFAVLFLLGAVAGRVAAVCACLLLADGTSSPQVSSGLVTCRGCGRPLPWLHRLLGDWCSGGCRSCQQREGWWPAVTVLAGGILFAGFGWLLLELGCQTVSEVRPSQELWRQRLPFHLLLLFLMLIVTITDLLDYSIPDLVVAAGAILAVVFAGWSGELQMIHVWVNWDAELVSLYGPYLPQWMKQHQHLHGLVWTMAGSLCGAGLMRLLRFVASTILGYPAVGLGDVTLMAMIGAFLGWQPTLCVLALAPLAGMLMGAVVWLFTGRAFMAFGPSLTLSALIVLCTWRWLWQDLGLRVIFSHWPTVAGLTGGSLLAISLLLTGMRLFRALPTERLRG